MAASTNAAIAGGTGDIICACLLRVHIARHRISIDISWRHRAATRQRRARRCTFLRERLALRGAQRCCSAARRAGIALSAACRSRAAGALITLFNAAAYQTLWPLAAGILHSLRFLQQTTCRCVTVCNIAHMAAAAYSYHST
jgi:hypothetical protein